MTASPIVDFEALSRREPAQVPYPHLIVPGFILEAAQTGIEEDYPAIAHPGSFPLALAAVWRALQGADRSADRARR